MEGATAGQVPFSGLALQIEPSDDASLTGTVLNKAS